MNLIHQRNLVVVRAALFVAAAVCPIAASYGASPRIAFDVSYTVECRDVTPDQYAESNPDSKIVEARFQVSTLIRRGEEEDVKQLMYVIRSIERRLSVVDFEPRTQVTSEISEPIQIVDSDEKSTSLDASVSVRISALAGVDLAPSAGGSRLNRRNLEQKYSKLPPKQLLIASGTTNRRHGVFFKLKPSSQASLEGQKEFVCLFVVPKLWRGDYACVECSAKAVSKTPWAAVEDCGSNKVLVGLYMQGDAEAREAARRLALAYDEYAHVGQSASSKGSNPTGEARGLFGRVPGSSLFESVIEDLAKENDEVTRRKDEAWKSFLTALEDLSRFTG